MTPPDLPLYFHPTTVCYIDDNYRFLESLAHATPREMSYRAFLTPEEALEVINQPHPRKPLTTRCFYRDGSRFGLDLAVLAEETHHVDRFDRISVLLVDHAMPTMDGIELCARVEDRDIKRILLTGVTDQKTALAAFNRGVIDHYLPKSKLASAGEVLSYIRDQQYEYFEQYPQRLRLAHRLEKPTFANEPLFLEHFKSLRESLAIVEFYLVLTPLGYLMLDAQGNAFHLVLRHASEIAEDIETMEEFDAPADLIDSVRNRSRLCYFYEEPQHYLGNEAFPWREFIYEATHIGGAEDWYCALVPDPPVDVDFDREVASYERYLSLRRPDVFEEPG